MEDKENSVAVGTSVDWGRLMLMTIISTTLRIFGPTLGLLGIGILVDWYLSTRPWAVVIGAILGAVIAVILVVQQLRMIREENQ